VPGWFPGDILRGRTGRRPSLIIPAGIAEEIAPEQGARTGTQSRTFVIERGAPPSQSHLRASIPPKRGNPSQANARGGRDRKIARTNPHSTGTSPRALNKKKRVALPRYGARMQVSFHFLLYSSVTGSGASFSPITARCSADPPFMGDVARRVNTSSTRMKTPLSAQPMPAKRERGRPARSNHRRCVSSGPAPPTTARRACPRPLSTTCFGAASPPPIPSGRRPAVPISPSPSVLAADRRT